MEAESAGRAFLISGAPALRSSYDATVAHLDDQVREYRQFTASNIPQQAVLGELEQRIARRFAYLEALMAVRASRGSEAMLRTAVGTGVQEMQGIKERIERMKQIEREVLAGHQSAQRVSDDYLQLALSLLVAAGLCLLSAVFRHMKRLWLARERAEGEALHQAHHDVLTGLPNRRLLHDRMHVALALAARQQSRVAVLSMDLDRFRYVNDTYGHDAGDELLRQVSARLAKLARAEDTVARMGGRVHPVALPGARHGRSSRRSRAYNRQRVRAVPHQGQRRQHRREYRRRVVSP